MTENVTTDMLGNSHQIVELWSKIKFIGANERVGSAGSQVKHSAARTRFRKADHAIITSWPVIGFDQFVSVPGLVGL